MVEPRFFRDALMENMAFGCERLRLGRWCVFLWAPGHRNLKETIQKGNSVRQALEELRPGLFHPKRFWRYGSKWGRTPNVPLNFHLLVSPVGFEGRLSLLGVIYILIPGDFSKWRSWTSYFLFGGLQGGSTVFPSALWE